MNVLQHLSRLRPYGRLLCPSVSACGADGQGVRLMASSAADQMQSIKALREKTNAPISDVKKCLVESNWDQDDAYDLLRKKGLAAAAKKASRQAAEGLVGVASSHGMAAVVEVNSETDFVARNENFTKLVSQVVEAALQMQQRSAEPGHGDVQIEQLLAAPCPGTPSSVHDAVTAVAAQMRENIKLRRAFLINSQNGQVSTYVHMPLASGLGRIASVVALEAADGRPLPTVAAGILQQLGAGLAMHVAGMRPQFVAQADVPAAALHAERQLLLAQAQQDSSLASKPQAVLEGIVNGRLNKWKQEVCLLEQKYVLDGDVTVKAILQKAGKEAGMQLRVAHMLRVQCGEGLQVQRASFAEEVAGMASGNS